MIQSKLAYPLSAFEICHPACKEMYGIWSSQWELGREADMPQGVSPIMKELKEYIYSLLTGVRATDGPLYSVKTAL